MSWTQVHVSGLPKTVEPDENYRIPFGKARLVLAAEETQIDKGQALVVITYGMGVHWALNAAQRFAGRVSILDLRTLVPLDEAAIFELLILFDCY